MANQRERERRDEGMVNARSWAQSTARGESTCVKLPPGVEPYKLTAGVHKVDFMMYVLGENNPAGQPGYWHFERTYDAHRIQGPNGMRLYACRKKWGKKCAACDWLTKHGGSGDQELVRQLRATTRHLWLVNDKPGDASNPLKVLDTNHFNKKKGFGEQMQTVITTLDEGVQPFAPKDGFTAILTCEEETFPPNGKYVLASRIDLRPRTYSYPTSVVKDAPCLDDMIIDPGYEEVWNLLTAGGGDDLPETHPADEPEPRAVSRRGEEDGPHQAARNSRQPEPEEEEDEPRPARGRTANREAVTAQSLGIDRESWVTYKGEECQVVKVSADGTTLSLEGQDADQFYRNVPVSEVTPLPVQDDEEPEETKAPARRQAATPARGRAAATEEDEPLDEDEPDLDEEEETPRRGRGRPSRRG